MKVRIKNVLIWMLVFVLLSANIGGFAEEAAASPESAVLRLPAALQIIEEEAFAGSTAIEKVVVPEGAAEIHSKAFANSSLAAIDLPASLTAIAADAFEGCGNITVSAPEDSYAYLWAVEKGYIQPVVPTPAEYFAYEIVNGEITITGYTGDDAEVIIPGEIDGYPVKRIGMDAFYACTRITSVLLPDSITTIEDYAFCECSSLETIILSASIASIGRNVFDACPQLTSITVDGNNPHYATVNGVLYSKDLAKLICYPAARITDNAYTIISGDSAGLSELLQGIALEGDYTLTSGNPNLVSVNGTTITAANATGRTTLTLTAGAAGGSPVQVSYTIDVIAAASVSLPEEDIFLRPCSTVPILYSVIPSNLIGTFACEPADQTLISFDPETGEITSYEIPGSTEILFQTFNAQFSCPVTVLEAPDYRALVISSYHGLGSNLDLPFASNNISTVQNTLAKSTVLGKQYSVTTATNPSKSSVKSLLRSTFAEATDDDVSLIYITTHGHNRDTGIGYNGYYFSLAPNYSMTDPNTYVTAPELMECLSAINGNVVLVLDSCYSGAFIQNCSSQLEACGNISVLTAQEGDKSASYYVGRSSATHAEFLTFALCYGLGVQMTDISLDSMLADRNGDGQVSVSETFNYARSYAMNLIAEYRSSYSASSKYGIKVPNCNTQAKFDAWSQNPQIYLAPGADELVLYAR